MSEPVQGSLGASAPSCGSPTGREPSSDAAFERLMDDMQVLYAMRAGHTVSQDDIDALNRLDAHWRSEEERATDAYHRGWTDSSRKNGGEALVAAEARASDQWAEAAMQKFMRLLAERRRDAALEALGDAYKFISQPTRMETPKGGPKTATYRVEGYNALTAKIRAVLFPSEAREGERSEVRANQKAQPQKDPNHV